jgi:hypothetical protein
MNHAYARIASVIAAALCTLPAAAHEGLETRTVEAAAWPAAPRQQAGSVLDYRLWLGHGRASFGIGLNAPFGVPFDAVPAPGGTTMVVGMRYRLSERSRLTIDSATWADGLQPERNLRMGFEFKPAGNPALGLARGSLRVQWTSRSQLSLRVRGGGLAFAYRSQFY